MTPRPRIWLWTSGHGVVEIFLFGSLSEISRLCGEVEQVIRASRRFVRLHVVATGSTVFGVRADCLAHLDDAIPTTILALERVDWPMSFAWTSNDAMQAVGTW